MTDKLLVVTYLWDDNKFKFRAKFKYGPQHVVALYQQLKRFLHVPFYFTVVCDEKMLTKMESWTHNYEYDQDINVSSDRDLNRIDTYRIWDDCKDMGRCWRRLRGYSAYEFGHLSRVMFIDLDMLIIDDITPIVKDNQNEPFVIADDSACISSKYNGSFALFTPTPTLHKMWSTFNKNPEACKRLVDMKGYQGSDQAWIRYYLDEVAHYPVKTIGLSDGLMSYRWHCLVAGLDPYEQNARIVNFHGPYMPDMPEIQKKHRWTQVYNAYGQRVIREKLPRGHNLISERSHQIAMTPRRLKQCVALIENGGYNEDIAELMGVTMGYVSSFFKKYPELVEARKVRDKK